MGNLDPSRGAATAGNDNPSGGRDDPADPRRSADDAGWLPDAADAAHGRGTQPCSTAARDRSTRKSKTSTGNPGCGKTAAGEPLLREPPSALTGGSLTTAVVHAKVGITLRLPSFWHEGRLQRTPLLDTAGFFFQPPSPGNKLQLPAFPTMSDR